MILRDTSSKSTHPATLGDAFTSVELERLVALRRDFTEHAEYSEFMTDPAQLEFARWLYAHGRICEHSIKHAS
ncbi:MAG TPA: hypothetical protein VIC27_05050 [Ktedonobacterales bacterium]